MNVTRLHVGPRAHAPARRAFSRWGLALASAAALAVLALSAPAAASSVQTARVGQHADFTRVVFELDQPAGYSVERRDAADGTPLLIISLNAELKEGAPLRLESASSLLESVTLTRLDGRTVATVRLKKADLPLKEMILKGPPRIVLDVVGRDTALVQKPVRRAPAPEKQVARAEPTTEPKPAPADPTPPPQAQPVPEPKPRQAEPPRAEPAPQRAAQAEASRKPQPAQAEASRKPQPAQAEASRKPQPAQAEASRKPQPAQAEQPEPPAAEPAPERPERDPSAEQAAREAMERRLAAVREAAEKRRRQMEAEKARDAEKAAPEGGDEPADAEPAAPMPRDGDSGGDSLPTPVLVGTAAGLLLLLVVAVVALTRRRSASGDDVAALGDAAVDPFQPEPGQEREPEQDRSADAPASEPLVGGAAPPAREPEEESEQAPLSAPGLFDESEKGDQAMETQGMQSTGQPMAGAPRSSGGGDVAQMMAEFERRIARLESQVEEANNARERLERQVAAQSEELRVQRAAIARTQRALRGLSRSDEDQATEPAIRD